MADTGPHTVAFTIRGSISRADLPGLCGRVRRILARSPGQVVLCDVDGVDVDAVTVDALARLQRAALAYGCSVRLCHSSEELLELVELMGLTDVLAGESDEFGVSIQSQLQPRDKEDVVAGNGSRKLFVNLAVADLDRSVDFFTKLGFAFDPRFTDETATCMLVGEDAYVMLLVQSKLSEFTKKELVDPTKQTEAIMAISGDSREEVDALADNALAAGGSLANEPMEMGFMYGRSFNDPDGHLWEVFWMDPAALEQAQAQSSVGSGAAA